MTATQENLNANSKAIRLNRDPSRYGTIAEIGAGQEVARWFFRVGGAAGTIAKTMSAYDMTFSDAIYGDSARYVSRGRLKSMLDHEYSLLEERLGDERGKETCFFAFANTVAATSFKVKDKGHGWMGIRFQTKPQAPPSDILMHVRLLDRDNVQQQEAAGILGVNLIYAAFHYLGSDNVHPFLDSLLDGINPDRVEIDVILGEGPDFEKLDNRIVNLLLVEKNMTHSVVFDPWGNVRHGSEMFYKKALLVERGTFRPVTRVNLDMLDAANEQFREDLGPDGPEILEVMEISTENLLQQGNADFLDFLERVDTLKALGKTVMVSNHAEFHKIAAYLGNYTDERIGVVLGVGLVKEVFHPKYYKAMDGGILEAFGHLFKDDLRLYVYPMLDADTGEVVRVEDLEFSGATAHLHRYCIEEGSLVGLQNRKPTEIPYSCREVCARIASGDETWETLVPPEVATFIKENHFFGYKA